MPSILDQKLAEVNAKTIQKSLDLGLVEPPAPRMKDVYSEELNPYADQSEGYTETPYGPVDNSNKIFNTYNQRDMNKFWSDLYDQNIRVDDDGYKYQLGPNGEKQYLKDQNIDTSYLYAGRTKTDDNVEKIGKAAFGAPERYTPGLAEQEGLYHGKKGYGWAPGPEGIDLNKLDANWQLPAGTTNTAEGLTHGGMQRIKNKVMFDDNSPQAVAKRIALGSGASEYSRVPEGEAIFGGIPNPTTGDAKYAEPRDIFAERGLEKPETVSSKDMVKIKPYSKMTDSEKYLYNSLRANEIEQQVADIDDPLVAHAKNAVTGLARTIGKGADYIAETTADILEAIQSPDEILEVDKKKGAEFRNKIRDLFNTDENEWKKAFGGAFNSTKAYQNKLGREIARDIKSGNYTGMIKTYIDNWDTLLAQSIPESAILAAAVGAGGPAALLGPLFTAATRMKDLKDNYKKQHGGKDMPKGMESAAFLANAASLGLEEILFIKPLMTAYGTLGKGMKNAVGKILGGAGGSGLLPKSLGNVAKGALGNMAFEGGQEILDQEVEKYFTSGKHLSPEEAAAAGLGGIVMSGVLNAPNIAISSPGAAATDIKRKQIENDISTVDKGLDSTDKAVANMETEGVISDLEERKKYVDEAIDKIPSMTKEEVLEYDNPAVQEEVKKEKLKAVNNNIKNLNIDKISDDDRMNFLDNAVYPLYKAREAGKVSNEELINLGYDIGENADTSDPYSDTGLAAIGDQSEKLLSNNDFVSKIATYLNENEKIKLFDSLPSNIQKEAIDNIASSVKQKLGKESSQLEKKLYSYKNIKEKISKTKPKPRIEDKDLDVSKFEEMNKATEKPSINNLFRVFKNWNSGSKVISELNKYSDNSLKKAREKATPAQVKIIDKVLDAREKAKDIAKIDTSERIQVKPISQEAVDKYKKGDARKALLNVVKPKAYSDMESVSNALDMVDKALKSGHINEAQAQTLKNRIAKIGENTKVEIAKDEEALKRTQEEEAKANEKGKEKDTNTNEGKRYQFKDDKGNVHEGTVEFYNAKDGIYKVKATIDGKEEELYFGYKRGNEVRQSGNKVRFSNGSIVTDNATHTEPPSNESGSEDGVVDEQMSENQPKTSQVAEDKAFEESEEVEGEEEIGEAAQRANAAENFGSNFNVNEETATDPETGKKINPEVKPEDLDQETRDLLDC